jgi:hypothetical protein
MIAGGRLPGGQAGPVRGHQRDEALPVGATGAQRADPIRCRGRPGRSAGPDGDPRVAEHQAGFAAGQAGREVEGGSGVVIALAAGLIGDAHVGLLQPFHRQAGSAEVGGGSGRPAAHRQAHRPGSPWWRAVSERILRDGCEAVALSGHIAGLASSRTVDYWMSFADYPTARAWYRAHNGSVVAAYLDHRDLAEAENEAERFFMNVALCRVLYTHALVAAPDLPWVASSARPVPR